tara:strand:- start:482 stop:919 length:438 start_codon:yes stop_codon:yes gene_type:complete
MVVKDKAILIVLSYLVGALGGDRMYLGCWGTGILKLLTLGGLGIWYLVDLWINVKNGLYKSTETSICGGYSWYPGSIRYGFFASVVIMISLLLGPAVWLITVLVSLIMGKRKKSKSTKVPALQQVRAQNDAEPRFRPKDDRLKKN